MPPQIEAWLAETSALTAVVIIFAVGWALKKLWGFILKSWPVLKGATKLIESLGELPEFINSLQEWKTEVDFKLEALEVIKKEFAPNHGSTLRDRVDEIAIRTADVERHELAYFERFEVLTRGFSMLAAMHVSESPEDYQKQQLSEITERLMQMPNQPDSC